MSLHRTTLRDAARAALKANARFVSFKFRKAWAQNIDTDGLPLISVATPGELSKSVSRDAIQRQIEMSVIIQRKGGDALEDVADLDAEAAETAVLTAIGPTAIDAQISQTDLRFSGEGASRVSTLDMRFSILVMTDRET